MDDHIAMKKLKLAEANNANDFSKGSMLEDEQAFLLEAAAGSREAFCSQIMRIRETGVS